MALDPGVAIHKLLASVDAIVGLKLLYTTLADKDMAIVPANLVLDRRW